ncbi:hypothetical protein NEOLI_004444 [Neolecta irregularis DAH-3]|uniref:Metallothionein n=1 Tax=Neolecta irregularis (strain DAH-3) TaxID=1198029 RepID=A0A1U7LPF9_NEOID|nr:hypothetical protein NEOLI_004444 [Neolecta irregularis DAH-3]|eukprot:OLL24473.1 hypothetical protein NEOLI_004444 [Neolecta irregularis DAH-3]
MSSTEIASSVTAAADQNCGCKGSGCCCGSLCACQGCSNKGLDVDACSCGSSDNCSCDKDNCKCRKCSDCKCAGATKKIPGCC